MQQRKKEISMQTKKRMAKILACIGDMEQQIEMTRQNLCNSPSFEPYSSFKRLDRNGNGYLTSYDICQFMK
jgi:hypothetical protein